MAPHDLQDLLAERKRRGRSGLVNFLSISKMGKYQSEGRAVSDAFHRSSPKNGTGISIRAYVTVDPAQEPVAAISPASLI